MKAADTPVGGRTAPAAHDRERLADEATSPSTALPRRRRLGAALVGVLLALLAAALCAGVGLLLAQAFFGTTGGIL